MPKSGKIPSSKMKYSFKNWAKRWASARELREAESDTESDGASYN